MRRSTGDPANASHFRFRPRPRRWFIQVVLISTFAFIVASWVTTIDKDFGLVDSKAGRGTLVTTHVACGGGWLQLSRAAMPAPDFQFRDIRWYRREITPLEPSFMWFGRDKYGGYNALGFRVNISEGSAPGWYVAIPLWFPAGACALILPWHLVLGRSRRIGFPVIPQRPASKPDNTHPTRPLN